MKHIIKLICLFIGINMMTIAFADLGGQNIEQYQVNSKTYLSGFVGIPLLALGAGYISQSPSKVNQNVRFSLPIFPLENLNTVSLISGQAQMYDGDNHILTGTLNTQYMFSSFPLIIG